MDTIPSSEATSPFWGWAPCAVSKQCLPLGQGMYLKSHVHVDLVALGLSKWVVGCCVVMFVKV